MPRSTAVEQVEPAGVPDLAPTPATSIDASDIAIPTLYIGHRQSRLIEAGLAKPGDIYAAQSQDDSEADVLWEYGSGAEGLLFHPLFMYKSWSWSAGAGTPLEVWPFEARGREYPDGPPLDDPDPKKRARLVYNYVVILPEVDLDMPYRTRFTGSSTPAAQKINMAVAKSGNPWYRHAFRWTTFKREKQGLGAWYPAQLTAADANNDHVKAAVKLFEQLAPGLQRMTQRGSSDSAPAPTI